MAALFLLALALIGWQAVHTKPLGPAPLSFAWTGGEQVFPTAAPWWGNPVALPQELPARHQALQEHSVLWPGVPTDGMCEVFIRTSSSTWVRRNLDPRSLEISGPKLHFSATDFLDDDDGDGDTLDTGELTRPGPGADVEVFCPS
ncbi:MAG TPA: hypothetical protein VMW27_04565 [Thermoanaerobaculia bacterium]|nr:hypothetical protein [Thermoanaerobaculia bacterium]